MLHALGFIACGDGGSEAECLLGFLGLPNCTSMDRDAFGDIERAISPFIHEVTEESL